MKTIVKIDIFDDGNDKYKSFPNKWKITKRMFYGEKLELINVYNHEIKINSISTWKTRVINE